MADIELFVFRVPESVGFGLLNPSPFCMKAEVWLRLAGLDYTLQSFDPFRAPLGKAPFVRIGGENGALLADSTVIANTLSDREDVSLDAHLDDDQRARAAIIQRVLEEHVYWGFLWQRWIEPTGWSAYRPIIASAIDVPIPGLKWLMLPFLRRGVVRSAHAQGLSRHPAPEIHRRLKEDWDGIRHLFVGPFAVGDAPSTVDATLYTWLEHAVYPLFDSAVGRSLRSDDVFSAYRERMRDLVFGAP